QITQIRIDRLSKSDVGDDSLPEKCMRRAIAGPIVELRWQNDVSRHVFLLQTSHRRHRNDPSNIQQAKRVNVGAVVYFVRQNPMAAAVSRQKINLTLA